MHLLKAGATTYRRVVLHSMHAVAARPRHLHVDELVLLSKNAEDCGPTEPQVQYVAKVLDIRPATAAALERAFGNEALGHDWRFIIDLYWPRRLSTPFNLSGVPGMTWKSFSPAHVFRKLPPMDELAILNHLIRTNADLLIEFANGINPTASDDDVA